MFKANDDNPYAEDATAVPVPAAAAPVAAPPTAAAVELAIPAAPAPEDD